MNCPVCKTEMSRIEKAEGRGQITDLQWEMESQPGVLWACPQCGFMTIETEFIWEHEVKVLTVPPNIAVVTNLKGKKENEKVILG